MLVWYIWNQHNSERLGESAIKVSIIRSKAEPLTLDFQSTSIPRSRPDPILSRPTSWKPPTFPLYKINFDGATFKDQGVAGLGVVIHYSHGLVIGVLLECILLPLSTAIVAALACRRALTFAKELSIFKSIVKGDVEVIVRALLAKDGSHLEYGHVLNDALSLVAKFRFCMFTHVKRLGNLAAHSLARRAKSGSEL